MNKIKLGKLEVDLEELREFLIEAKKKSYASGRKSLICEDGSEMITFHNGNFHYTDNWAGFYQFSGTEIVRWQRPDGQRIWQMGYHGAMFFTLLGNERKTEEVFDLLKKALSNPDSKLPLRGPLWTSHDNLEYHIDVAGDIKKFSGNEKIRQHGGLVFVSNYSGGLIIPK